MVIRMSKLNNELSENQMIAINHNIGPMMALSGPGSGKTTVITHRVKNLIECYDVLERDILVITFTKASADEMEKRFATLSDCKGVTFGTFHSYFFRIIRNHHKYNLSSVIYEYEAVDIIIEITNTLNIYLENSKEDAQNIASEVSLVKNDMIPVEFFESSVLKDEEFRTVFEQYENYKEENHKIDFDDMLTKCFELISQDENARNFWKNKYKYILIDEFQDINRVQYECIKLLLSDEKNLFIVGDDDQSIYSFRGASPDFLLNFPDEFEGTKIVKLDINYRSTNEIIELSNCIIKDNLNRYEKDIVGTGKTSIIPQAIQSEDMRDEARKITDKIIEFSEKYPLNEIAVIYRTNLQAQSFVESFMDRNIEYQIKDKIPSIYEHHVARDIFAYLRLSLNNLDNTSFIRIANKPSRYISKILLRSAKDICKEEISMIDYFRSNRDLEDWQTERFDLLKYHLSQMKNKNTYDTIKYIFNKIGYVDYIDDYAQFRKINPDGLIEIANEILESSKEHENISEYLSYTENIAVEVNKSNRNNKSSGVVLSTMHSAKGLEFDIVFVISCIDGIIPHRKSLSSNLEIEEERRLFYVAITRPRELLFISLIDNKHERISKPSRFLQKVLK